LIETMSERHQVCSNEVNSTQPVEFRRGFPMSDSVFLLATAYRVVYSVLGCDLTARLAPNRTMEKDLHLALNGIRLRLY
jgi:hypothetical protein